MTDANQFKFPGYQQAQELTKLYQQAGFSDKEITEELIKIQTLLLNEVVEEVQEKMTKEERIKFDEFLNTSPTLQQIVEFLRLDRKTIAQKIEAKLETFINQLKADLNTLKPTTKI